MNIKNCTPALFVKDAKKSRDFYVNILGMNVVSDFGGLNYCFKEGFSVWQILEDNIIPQKLGMDAITNSKVVSRFELSFETEDIDAVFKTLKENNVSFFHEIITELWQQRTFKFYDIDGHLIDVGESMHIFLRRVYDEEEQDVVATCKRTYVTSDFLKQALEL